MSDNQIAGLSVDLAGKTAIVTGASQGLGRAVAVTLGASGARVACVARNADKLQGTVETTLKRYALRADLELRNQTEDWAMIDITGPDSAAVGPEPMQPGQVLSWEILGGRTVLARTDLPLQPTLRWLVPAGLEQAALDHLRTAGLERIDHAAATALRMEAGIPVFGTDVGPDNLVLEVPAYRSGISFDKGCYVGQETVARLHARGENLARHLRGILTDQEPEPGTALEYRGKEVGSVSSTTWSPLAGKYLSLALVHRSATEDGTAVTIGPLTGEVTTLPIQDG